MHVSVENLMNNFMENITIYDYHSDRNYKHDLFFTSVDAIFSSYKQKLVASNIGAQIIRIQNENHTFGLIRNTLL